MSKAMADWRDDVPITKAKSLCKELSEDAFSVGILASGGLLDTIAAVRAKLAPIWGSDIDPLICNYYGKTSPVWKPLAILLK